MTDVTDKYESGADNLYFGENGITNFSLYSYASSQLQQTINNYLATGLSTMPTVEDAENKTKLSINGNSSETVESILRTNTFDALVYYLGKNDRALAEVFSPYSSLIRTGEMTYGEAVSKGVSGTYSSVYGTDLGYAAKSAIGIAIFIELYGSAIEVKNSSTPLNEAGKQAWGIAGWLAGGDLGAAVLLGVAGVVGITSSPALFGIGALGALVGASAGEKYMEYAYNNLLPQVLSGTLGMAALDIADYTYDLVKNFVDDLWESTGESAADFFDFLAEGAGDTGEVLTDLTNDYGWTPEEPSEISAWLANKILPSIHTAAGLESPLVLDLDGDGIELAAMNGPGSVYWDSGDGDDFREASGWIAGGDGLLCVDLNQNGMIDGQAELFGNNGTYANGYLALDAYADSNNDNAATATDTNFANLLVWVDANSDGYSQEEELHTLADLGITSISTNYSNVNIANAGNTIKQQSTFVMNGNTRTSADAWFAYDNVNTAYAGDYTLDIRTLFLPTLRGYGNLPDLHIAMSLDNTGADNLLDKVMALGTLGIDDIFAPNDDVLQTVREILFRWAGVEEVAADSRGDFIDARELAFLEKLTAEPYHQTGNSNATSPLILASHKLEAAFQTALNNFYTRLVIQGAAGELLEGDWSYNPATDKITGVTGLNEQMIDDLVLQAASLSSQDDRMELWKNVVRVIDYTVGVSNLSSGDHALLEGALTSSAIDLQDDILPSLLFNFPTKGDKITGDYRDDILHGSDRGEGLYGGSGDDEIHGYGGDDYIDGGYGTDIIYGGAGNDYMRGGHDGDVYVFGLDSGNDFIDEQYNTGINSIKFEAGISLSDLTITRYGYGNLLISIDAGSSNSTIMLHEQISYETSTGYISYIEFSDSSTFSLDTLSWQILGTSSADVLWGTGNGANPNDVIYGYDGADTIYGRHGDDYIDGGNHADTLYGDEGNDTLIGGLNADTLYGGDGDDTLNGGEWNDTIYGGNGTDTAVWNTNSTNFIIYRNSADYITVKDTGNVSSSGFGTDKIYNDVEYIVFNDITIDLSTTSFSLNGPAWGNPAAIYGTSANDTLNGTPADDAIYGYDGKDIIHGNAGNDYIDGGEGNDTLYGDAGDDIIRFGDGADTVYGGAGADIFLFDFVFSGINSDKIADFNILQGDKIDISNILEGYDPLTNAITDWVQISTSGSDSTLRVDIDGGADGFIRIATISGVTGLTDEAALVASGNLVVI